MARVRIGSGTDNGGQYFDREPDVRLFSAGCTLLDCVLGGGWPLGRIANLVGDKSTGKTLLAIEAAANFVDEFPSGIVRYAEVEAAFDPGYAEALGLPSENVEFPKDIFTVEDLFKDLDGALARASSDSPMLYIVDSLDALSSKDELARDFGEGTYGTGKAKDMSLLFRRLVQRMEKGAVTLIIISQIRDKIGVTFGKKTTRSGGRSLDFYASQVVELAQLKRLKRQRKNVERAYGVQVKAQCTKNKVGMPFRECEFPIIFTFGVEDVVAGVEWLKSVKRLDALGLGDADGAKFLRTLERASDAEYAKERARVSDAVRKVWAEIEREHRPTRRKYSR